MNIKENILIKDHTTFKTGGPALFFIEIATVDELIEAIKFAKAKNLPHFIMGGGSNLLASDEMYRGVVIKMQIKGIEFASTNEVIASAGETWDDFVELTVSKGYSGLENLSAIPGTVGASPIQNIGAYGSEVEDRIVWVEALDSTSEDFEIRRFTNSECDFSYRNSFFKSPEGKKFVTIRVCFKLDIFRDSKSVESDVADPANSEDSVIFEKAKMYKDLREYFESREVRDGDIRPLDIRNAVIEIRENKLPDWHILSTAGSFFKNPIILETEYQNLLKKYPELPAYSASRSNSVPPSQKTVKIPLGWVLDKICGLKGYREGKVSTYRDQALVIVSEGATAKEINNFADRITSIVKERTGIIIEREVNTL